jgi:PAS domain S-box-containing protein
VTLFVDRVGRLPRSPKRQRASQVAGAAAVAIAAAVLVGRWAGMPLLSSWAPGLPAMRPLGALCLAAIGLVLIHPGKDQRFAVVAGISVASLAAFFLGSLLLRFDVSIEWLALRSPVLSTTVQDEAAFRIAHAATLAFGLAGSSLALSRFERYRLVATLLAGLTAAITVFGLLGYLTGIDTLYGSAAVASPPLPTAVGLLWVAFGILLRIGAMPALRTPRPLWHLLVALGGAIIVPLLLFGAYAEVSIADAQLNEARRHLLQEARTLSAEVDREIFGEIERLEALAASPSLRHGDFAEFQREAEASLALRQSGNIMLIDRNLGLLVNTWVQYGTPMGKPSVGESVERAFATGKPQFTDLFVGPMTRQIMFGIVVPVEIAGENRYALVRSAGQRGLTEPIAADKLPTGWQAVIAGARHNVLARSGPRPSVPLQAEGEKELVETALPQAQWHGAGSGGVFNFSDPDGRGWLEGYAYSDLTGWETAVWAPSALFEAPVRALWRTLGWLALLSVALVVALALWLGRLIAHSVGYAANAATGLGEGRLPPPGGTPVAEVNTMISELREAAAKRQMADDLLRESERQLRLVTDNVPVAIARCDADGRYTFANKQLMERHGLACEQIIGKRIPEVIGEKGFAAVERYVGECLAGKAVEFELKTTDRAGEPMFLQARLAPEWRDSKVVGLVGATSDITRLKRAEQRLRASEVTFRQLVDNSPFGIYVVDPGFRFVQASIGARKMFENFQPLIGRDLAEVLRSTWPEPFACEAIGRFRHTFATGEPYHSPRSTAQRKDSGAVEPYDWKIERVTMPDGCFGVVCHFYDLSERQKYEAALRESEATFRAMFDSSAVGKIEVDVKSGRFLRANAAMCKFVGYTEAELLGRRVFDITHPDERDKVLETLRSMEAGTLLVFDNERRYVRKDGNVVWARVTANTIRNEAGRPVRSIAVIQDLNERKRAEQNLEASKTRLQLALDAARLGWFQYDPLHRSCRGDARFKEIFDLAGHETPADELTSRVHPDDLEKAMASLKASLDPADPKPAVIEYRIRRRDGEVRWVEIHSLTYFEGVGSERRAVCLIGTAQDITERKLHEEQTQLLMREVNHRAKNMLSVVDAIAHQTAARSPDDFIARFSERIQALSANQDLLVRNEWNGVDIEDLVCAQLAHFSDLIGSRIVVYGPSLRLKAASAQAIGLALHELATNAGKYGALSTDTGRVRIDWRIDDGAFHMSWTECNGPPVSAPKQRGFGTVVVEVMAERTVGGHVSLDLAPSGVTWRLTCPAANALDRPEREPAAARIPA